MAVRPYSAALAVAELLRDQGIRACLDMRDLNPPAVLIQAPDLTYRFDLETADAIWTALVTAPNTGSQPSLQLLQGLLGDTVAALAAAGIAPTDARAVTINPRPNDPTGALPAYSITWTDTLY